MVGMADVESNMPDRLLSLYGKIFYCSMAIRRIRSLPLLDDPGHNKRHAHQKAWQNMPTGAPPRYSLTLMESGTDHYGQIMTQSHHRTTLMNLGISHGLLDVADMISALELDGIDTDEKTVCGILDMGEESFHLLARLATDDEYWNDLDGDWPVPICAIHLLAKMKHYRAHLARKAGRLRLGRPA